MKNQNGNPQMNEAREGVNERTSKKAMLGKSKRQDWNRSRRFRSI